mmetsp:Transcript_27743/g.70001  ORF Transcript_27743/g.70001 Transcript_27743/m.70001 type:complete len:149 (+) Transcript_27743:114-560(+)
MASRTLDHVEDQGESLAAALREIAAHMGSAANTARGLEEQAKIVTKNVDMYSYGPPKRLYRPAISNEVIMRRGFGGAEDDRGGASAGAAVLAVAAGGRGDSTSSEKAKDDEDEENNDVGKHKRKWREKRNLCGDLMVSFERGAKLSFL